MVRSRSSVAYGNQEEKRQQVATISTGIYHITHVDNLVGVVEVGGLWCDREAGARGLTKVGIAHQHIKVRRAQRHVPLGPGGTLDDFVPFYFAPRSPMLYSIHNGYVEGYSEGQRNVIHLESSAETISDSEASFVFTDGHAEMNLSEFFDELDDLDKIDWEIMKETYWADTDEDGDRKRRRQAEFLVHRFVPWRLIARIGVFDMAMAEHVTEILGDVAAKPLVTVERGWYY